MRRVRDHRRGPGDDGWREALVRSELPQRYWRAKLESISKAPLRDWVSRTLEAEAQWLAEGRGHYLMGELNAGKSFIAALFLMDAVRRCDRALWLPVREVPTAIFRDGDRGEMLNAKLRGCDLLVLDDLGSERFRLGSAAGSALEETVRTVYDRGRSLIITSNLSWRQLGDHYTAEAGPFVSVLRRMIEPFHVDNDQWPLEPMNGR